MKDVIVIGADHYNTLWLVRSLGIGGFNPIVIVVGAHCGRSFVSKSKYCKQCYHIKSIDDIVATLLSFQFSERIVIFTSGDPYAVVIDKNYNQLSQKYILQGCNNREGELVYWMDKDNMLAMAKECGLSIPYTRKLDLSEDIDFSEIPYPCLIKPEISAESTKNTFRICQNIEELRHSISEVRGDCKNVILQEFIQPDFECLLYGVSTEIEVFLPGALHKIHTCSDTNNLGMMTYSYLSPDIPSQIGDIKKLKDFVKKMGYHGVFSVEFMITRNKAYFLEINLRNDGTCYITTQAGVNIPAIWAASSYGLATNNYHKVFNRERTYGMNEINYFKYTMKKVGIIQTIKDVCKAKAFSLYNANDLRPFFYKFIYH